MKFIDWIFINIYGQTQRLDNMNRNNIDGKSWTSIILGLFIGGWYPFFKTLYCRFKSYTDVSISQTDSWITVLIVFCFAGLIYFFYSQSKRFSKIYIEYQKTNKLISKTSGFLLCIFLMLVPYIFWIIILLW